VKGGRRRSLAAAPWVGPGEVGPLDYMFPTCAVHPVPLELRRLVEGISSGPDDSREHRREQDLVFSFFAASYAMYLQQPADHDVVRAQKIVGGRQGRWLEMATCKYLFNNDLQYRFLATREVGGGSRGGEARWRVERATRWLDRGGRPQRRA